MYKKILKSIFDRIFSVFLLLAFIWLFIIIGVFIKILSPGPIIFKQKRIGKDKKEFIIYKFRTMYYDTPSEVPTNKLHESNKYITPIGFFLRKTSLDELPQLVNIAKGDMSFVGPRPALWNQYDLIREREKYGANNIKPGLTGWAQVNGRDEIPIKLKANLDGIYTCNISFILDCKCILKTILYVIKQEGIKEGI